MINGVSFGEFSDLSDSFKKFLDSQLGSERYNFLLTKFPLSSSPIFIPPWQCVDGLCDNLLSVNVPDDHLVVNQELVLAGKGGRDPGVLFPHVLLDPGEPVPGKQPLSRHLVSDLNKFINDHQSKHFVRLSV